MIFWQQCLILVPLFMLALASPGPDFVMAVRNSVLYGRRVGVFTALGFGLGVGVHVTYCMLGFSAIIASSVLLFDILKTMGAAYLIWVGFKALRSKGMEKVDISAKGTPQKTDLQAFRDGFVTNVLNPKAVLFFFALFTQVLQPHQPLMHMVCYGLICIGMCATWFSVVALFLAQEKVRKVFLNFSGTLDKICGTLFILLGLRLALQKAPI